MVAELGSWLPNQVCCLEALSEQGPPHSIALHGKSPLSDPISVQEFYLQSLVGNRLLMVTYCGVCFANDILV